MLLYNYPRLDTAAALEMIREQAGQPVGDLVSAARESHARVSWYPTARDQVPVERLRQIQTEARAIARVYGYPGVGRGRGLTEFDQQLGRLLFDRMDILPAEAAHPGVWAFLSLVLMPDVAHWRFPNLQAKDDYERLTGGDRNVFRRVWWRSYALGPELAEKLLEDEAVGIMERPSIGMCPSVARAVARQHIATIEANPALARTQLMRDATKRLRRLSPNLSLYSLSDEDIRVLVAEVFDSSVAALAPRLAPAPTTGSVTSSTDPQDGLNAKRGRRWTRRRP